MEPEQEQDRDNDEERLMTRIDGEEAQLLVHIERTDDADPDTTADPHAGSSSLEFPPASEE